MKEGRTGGYYDHEPHRYPYAYCARTLSRMARGARGNGRRHANSCLDPNITLDFMDRNEIATSILSISTPSVHFGGLTEGRDKAREVNEETAELVARNSDRFGFFATVTLPDVEGAIAEAEYALDVLKADGIVLMTNVDGVYLGDARFDPLLAALDRRHAVVFCHPGHLPGPTADGIPPFVADFLLDTVRAAINLSKVDAHQRFPNLSIILSHGGGFIPYAASRIARACAPGLSDDIGLQRLRRFYFDTALTSSPFGMPSLLAFADMDRIVFGSDLPYAHDARATAFTHMLDQYPMQPAHRVAVARGNAQRLFPRLSR